MMLPQESERDQRELDRRLTQFRHEAAAVGNSPSQAAIERLLARASELNLPADDVADDLAQLRARLEELDLRERIARGDLPAAEAPDPLPAGDSCCFVCAVRFGRRRADQFGHLVLSKRWLRFRGALDMSIPWNEVHTVSRDGRDLVITLHETRRVLRFSCGSFSEAARAGVIGEHLVEAAKIRSKTTSMHQIAL